MKNSPNSIKPLLFSPSGEKQVPHSVETGQLVVNQLKSPVSKIRRISRRRKLAPLVLVKHNAEHERLGVGDNGAQRRRTGGDAALAEPTEAQRLAAVPAQCALCKFESLFLVICACAIFE